MQELSQKAPQNILELDSLINTAVTGSVIMVNKGKLCWLGHFASSNRDMVSLRAVV